VSIKKRCTFMIEPDILDRLSSISARTGLSKSEQIRQGIRWWLESREWPGSEHSTGTVGSLTRPTHAGPAKAGPYSRARRRVRKPRQAR
jgi:metal-responsive CopG/Arc/MetJ family transcriptional regulator